jgi:hypothetical protein
MKIAKKNARSVIALALAWDGSRQPVRSLPPAARAFLKTGSGKAPRAAAVAKLLAARKISELRICWVPRLTGGENTLAAPFSTPEGLRVHFRAVRQRRFGDVLGVVYRSAK